MKTAGINNVIVCVSAIVFLLQAVGYFTPAWFVQEVMVGTDSREMLADGRIFSLPYNQDTERAAGSAMGMASNTDDSSTAGTGANDNSHMDKRNVRRKRHGSSDEAGTGEGHNMDGENSEQDDEPSPPISEGLGHDMGTDSDTCADDSTEGNTMGGNSGKDNDPADMGAIQGKGGIYRMYLTAGLWYSRACITAENTDDEGADGTRMQWCTLYLRTEDNTLGKSTFSQINGK